MKSLFGLFVDEDTREAEFNRLSWELIEHKVAYYLPEQVHPSRLPDYEVPDEIYDAKELRYLTLCKELGKMNTIVHKVGDGMMEVDISRPSVQLVLRKLGSQK